MNFSCDQCQSRYSLPDERLLGKSVRVRCKKCQNMMTVGPLEPMLASPRRSTAAAPRATGSPAAIRAAAPAPAAVASSPSAPWDDEPTRAHPAPDPGAQWFAMLAGKQEGPLGPAQLAAHVSSGQVSARTYLWRTGMADWKRASDLPEVAVLLSANEGTPTRAAPPRSTGSNPPVRASQVRRAEPVPEPEAEQEPEPEPEEDSFFDREERTQVAPAPQTPAPRRSPGPSASGATARASSTKAAPVAPANSKVDLETLFSDVEVPVEDEKTRLVPGKAVARKSARNHSPVAEEEDPFASLGELDPSKLPAAGEATSFFIAQAGVHKRNPPWKIAAFVAGGIAFPVFLYLILSSLNVVPAEIHHVDASGKQVASKVFSSDGLSALGHMLMGGGKAKPAAPAAPGAHRRTLTAAGPLPKDHPVGNEVPSGPRGGSTGTAVLDTQGADLARNQASPQVKQDLKKIYGESAKSDVGPGLNRLAQRDAVAATDASGGPPPEVISKVVGQTQPAFQFCIEQQLKKNPRFKGGKVSLIATVAASGIVKRTQIDRHDIDASDLGDCLKVKAKRMTFPPFKGDEVDLDIPLILTTAM